MYVQPLRPCLRKPAKHFVLEKMSQWQIAVWFHKLQMPIGKHDAYLHSHIIHVKFIFKC